MEDYFQIRWIYNDPFASRTTVCRSFHVGYPNAGHWYVELEPLIRRDTYLSFLCSLIYDDRSEATAETLKIEIFLNDVRQSSHLVLDYPFCADTRYLHSFEVLLQDYDRGKPNTLKILVRVDMKKEGIGAARLRRHDAEMPLLRGGEEIDLVTLCEAMHECQRTRKYFTMTIFSKNDEEFPVHHYILKVRWPDLFIVHNLDENSTSALTRISAEVLHFILIYMYSGVLIYFPEIWGEVLLVAELFQVICTHQMYHLIEALSTINMPQAQYSRTFVDRRRLSIPLPSIRTTDPSQQSITFPVFIYRFAVNPPRSGVHIFQFTVHVNRLKRFIAAGPWLSYSVLSLTEIPYSLEISLGIPVEDGSIRRVHFAELHIPGKRRSDSGPILFLGCHQTFTGIYRHLQSAENCAELLFGLAFYNEEPSASIWHKSKLAVPTDPSQVFSEHMGRILMDRYKTDLVVQPGITDNGSRVQYRIHKAIFEARLPGWRTAVEPNLAADAILPDTVVLPLSSDSCRLVESYLYTGKMFRVPEPLIEEIAQFAHRCRLGPLQALGETMHDFDA